MAIKKGSGEAVSADVSNLYENILEFKDFEDIAKKNDVSSKTEFGKCEVLTEDAMQIFRLIIYLVCVFVHVSN